MFGQASLTLLPTGESSHICPFPNPCGSANFTNGWSIVCRDTESLAEEGKQKYTLGRFVKLPKLPWVEKLLTLLRFSSLDCTQTHSLGRVIGAEHREINVIITQRIQQKGKPGPLHLPLCQTRHQNKTTLNYLARSYPFQCFLTCISSFDWNILKWLKIMQSIVSTRPGTIKYRSHPQLSLHVISIKVTLGSRQCGMNEMKNNPGPSESLCT